ncbi:YaaC family protein [Streptomyces sp. NPDC099088]|uniref:YaaC family protein n=1 Tax=Streptomyces sp. NPDC099088 TaxID=3366101 RepID=UPI003825F871
MPIEASEAWARLRASRLGRANGGARAKAYATALEQAQQMFRAAEVARSETRPLLAFYGLSHAGRAIAAAAVSFDGEDWNLTSQGIHASGYHLDFADIEICPDPAGTAGSFVRLSELLHSPVWGDGTVVRLEEVWNTLPVSLEYPLTDRERLTPLYASRAALVSTDFHSLLTVEVGNIPDRVVNDGSRVALDRFLAGYPGTAGYADFAHRRVGPEDRPDYRRRQPGAGWLSMHWRMLAETGTEDQRRERLYTMTRNYAGRHYFFPAIADLQQELHPLMAWWAALYVLSMLARYRPAQWASLIDLDGSRNAVPIEKMLEHAVEHLPVLITEAMEEVAISPSPRSYP